MGLPVGVCHHQAQSFPGERDLDLKAVEEKPREESGNSQAQVEARDVLTARPNALPKMRSSMDGYFLPRLCEPYPPGRTGRKKAWPDILPTRLDLRRIWNTDDRRPGEKARRIIMRAEPYVMEAVARGLDVREIVCDIMNRPADTNKIAF